MDNEKSHLPRVSRDQKVWKEVKKTPLRAEENSVEMMENIVRKFSRVGNLAMDACAGVLFTAKAFVTIRNRRFAGCDVDTECMGEGRYAHYAVGFCEARNQ